MHGEKDKLVPEAVMREAAAATAENGSRFVNIPDAGHMAPLDQPEKVCEAIVGFLEEVGC
jgi:pimeloyl-ACP methyl ester carboxylesterase